MALGLDLSASEAKVTRAREHCEALQAKVTSLIARQKPYSLRGEVENSTGRLRIFVSLATFDEPGVSVVVGDIFHNLRSALAYIVTSITVATSVPLTRKNQFP